MRKTRAIGFGVALVVAVSLLAACENSDEEKEILQDEVVEQAAKKAEEMAEAIAEPIENATNAIEELDQKIQEANETLEKEVEVIPEGELDQAPVGEPMGDVDPNTIISSEEAELVDSTEK